MSTAGYETRYSNPQTPPAMDMPDASLKSATAPIVIQKGESASVSLRSTSSISQLSASPFTWSSTYEEVFSQSCSCSEVVAATAVTAIERRPTAITIPPPRTPMEIANNDGVSPPLIGLSSPTNREITAIRFPTSPSPNGKRKSRDSPVHKRKRGDSF